MKRRVAVAGAFAAFTFVIAFAALPRAGVSTWLVSLIGGGVSPLQHHGGAVLEYSVAEGGDTAAVVAAMKRRGASRAFAKTGNTVVVELPGVDRRGAEAAAAVYGSNGELEIRVVHENSELMRRIYRHVAADADARMRRLIAQVDMWQHNASGRQFRDYYIFGPTAQALSKYLATLAQQSDELAPDSEHELAIEIVRAWDQRELRTTARSYYTYSKAEITRSDIAGAVVIWNPTTHWPEVLVTLTKDGGRRFETLTARTVGRKLAIILDGQVKSAPVVQSAISGGSLTISMGRADARAARAEAEALASVLLAGALPAKVRLASVRVVDSTVSGAKIALARGLFALFLGGLVFLVVFLMERRIDGLESHAYGSGAPGRLRKLGVTLAALVAVYFSGRIDLPTLAEDSAVRMGLFDLGLISVFGAFVLVELIALTIPKLRPLRTSGPRGRAVLGLVTAVLATVFALAQAFFISRWLGTMFEGDMAMFVPQASFRQIPMPILTTTLTLAGAVMVLVVMASLVDRYGLGNGYSVLLLGGAIAQLKSAYSYLADDRLLMAELGWTVVLALAAVGGTCWLLRYRVSADSSTSRVRLPTAGIIPLQWAFALGSVIGALLFMRLEVVPDSFLLRWNHIFDMVGQGKWPLYLATTVGLTAVLSMWFSRPRPLTGDDIAVRGEARQMHRLFWKATAITVVFLTGLAALHLLWRGRVQWTFLDLASLMVGTAVVMDLVLEWRAHSAHAELVPVWPVHRIPAVDVAVHALTSAGIPVHTRGVHHRTLLHFFGPFVPVSLMVPPEHAERAGQILRSVFLSAPLR